MIDFGANAVLRFDPATERFTPTYFDDHPIGRAGVAVGRDLRPDGFENVLVAGATLAGAQPWKEKSGDGISLATGYRAAELILGAQVYLAEVS